MECTLLSPDAARQFDLGLDDDVRFVGQIGTGAVVCFGAENAGEAYLIGARRGGGRFILGDSPFHPLWPRWPHRAESYPAHEAFFWAAPAMGSGMDLAGELAADQPDLIGLGLGTLDGVPIVLVELGADDPEILDAAIAALPLGPWMGGKITHSIVAAPAIAR